MNRKIIFLDIDGTLTIPGHNDPPESAVRAIEQAQKNGHIVFVCTGRNLDMIRPLRKYSFDGWITSSGTYVEYQGKELLNISMPEERTRQLVDDLRANGVYLTLECLDASYTDESFKQFLRDHSSEGRNSEYLRWKEAFDRNLHIISMEYYQGQPLHKIVMFSRELDNVNRVKAQYEDQYLFCFQTTEYGFVDGEITDKKYSKGTAVWLVCEHLGIPVEDALGFGDSMNDMEMLKACGVGICMENGSPALKEYADDVCPAVEEDGLCRAFEKYGLI